MQESFLEVIQKIGDLKNPEAFPAWLKEITYHQCTRYYRKKETVHEFSANEAEDGYSVFDELEERNAAFLPDEALDQKELRKAILEMVEALPDVQRSALYMFYYDELPLKAIAQAQGVSVNTANTRLNRGRKAVKGSIEQYENKNGIRLHSVAFLPLLRWLLSEGEATMPLESVTHVAQQLSAQTGVSIAGETVDASAAATGISAKIATLPIAAKIIAGLVAASISLSIPAVLYTEKDPMPSISQVPIEETCTQQTTLPVETESTIPTTKPRINLIDSFAPDQQKKLNIFLSNFAEQWFREYPAETDLNLLHFAWTYCYLNTNNIEDVDSYTRRLAASDVDATLNRFFGTMIEHRTMDSLVYRDGYYYGPAADGEFCGYFAVAREMYKNEDSTFEVIYDVYSARRYIDGYVMYHDDVSTYYGLAPDQLTEYSELEFQYTGTAILRDHIRSNGEKSYQVITLDRLNVT